MTFYAIFAISVLIVYFTAFICCCGVFAVLTCTLGSIPDVYFQEICDMSEANLNDVTAMHQKLWKKLLSASQALKSWFLVHWLKFGMYCLAVFAFDSIHFKLLPRQFSGTPIVFLAIIFAPNFAIFLSCAMCLRLKSNTEMRGFAVQGEQHELRGLERGTSFSRTRQSEWFHFLC